MIVLTETRVHCIISIFRHHAAVVESLSLKAALGAHESQNYKPATMPRSLTDFPAHGEGEKSANAATGASHSRIPSFLRSRIVQALIVVAFLIVIIVPPAVILTGGDGGSSDGGESGSGDSRPNIIFVLVDDQDSRMNSIDHMPLLRKHMIDQGTTFPNHYCTSALCCPARAVIWTGRNAHNTNITALAPPYGTDPILSELALTDKVATQSL